MAKHKANIKPFNVIWENINIGKIEAYDIMPHLINRYKAIPAKKRFSDYEEIKQMVIRESRYRWWSRCEYEIIIRDFPNETYSDKWDIFRQIMLNIDIVTDVLIENLKILKLIKQ